MNQTNPACLLDCQLNTWKILPGVFWAVIVSQLFMGRRIRVANSKRFLRQGTKATILLESASTTLNPNTERSEEADAAWWCVFWVAMKFSSSWYDFHNVTFSLLKRKPRRHSIYLNGLSSSFDHWLLSWCTFFCVSEIDNRVSEGVLTLPRLTAWWSLGCILILHCQPQYQ